LEEFDSSHNQFSGIFGFYGVGGIMPKLKKLNLSFNALSNISLHAPALTHLDISNNVLSELNLQDSSKNLVELNCSSNQLNKLVLSEMPNLKSFDCIGINFDKSMTYSSIPTTTISSSVSSITSAETAVCTNNSVPLGSTIGLATYSGLSTIV